jgi:hypothetical protein
MEYSGTVFPEAGHQSLIDSICLAALGAPINYQMLGIDHRKRSKWPPRHTFSEKIPVNQRKYQTIVASFDRRSIVVVVIMLHDIVVSYSRSVQES